MPKLLTVAELMKEKQSEILDVWIEVIDRESGAGAGAGRRTDMLMSAKDLRSETKSLADALTLAFASEDYDDIDSVQFQPVVTLLRDISASRASQGFSPTETAMFVMSLKSALLQFMQKEFSADPLHLNGEVVKMNVVIDRLAMVTFETYAQTRENVIGEQSRSLLEMSSPVIKLWDNVVMLPLVGIIDTQRSQLIINELLKGIVEHQAQVAVLDVTGVPIIDTQVSQHLINTVDAARMLGSEVILTGISPDIAQTLVRLNIDLSGLKTSGLLKNGIKDALDVIGMHITGKGA